MEVTEQSDSVPENPPERVVQKEVTVHRSCPGRAVFTEADNTDGWISTDYTVDLLR